MLCQNNFRPELLRDIDMLLIFEKGIRGGITQAVKRNAKANNKYMKDQYSPDEKSTYLQYLDANNLYEWAMIQKLPTHGFSWEKVEDFTPEKIDKLVKKDNTGFILELDVEYPKEVHKNHKELIFLAERMKIGKVEKLVPNLKDKNTLCSTHQKLESNMKAWFKIKKSISGC